MRAPLVCGVRRVCVCARACHVLACFCARGSALRFCACVYVCVQCLARVRAWNQNVGTVVALAARLGHHQAHGWARRWRRRRTHSEAGAQRLACCRKCGCMCVFASGQASGAGVRVVVIVVVAASELMRALGDCACVRVRSYTRVAKATTSSTGGLGGERAGAAKGTTTVKQVRRVLREWAGRGVRGRCVRVHASRQAAGGRRGCACYCDRYRDRGGAGVRFGEGDAKRDSIWFFELATVGCRRARIP